MSVVIVGNGPSVKGKCLGAAIDSHERVFRFNMFVTKGYESDVGQRTTDWAISVKKDSSYLLGGAFEERMATGVKTIWVNHKLFAECPDLFVGFIRCTKADPNIIRHYLPTTELLSRFLLDELATSGFLAVMTCLNNPSDYPIHLVGFSLEDRDHGTHYFATNTAWKHNWNKECELLLSLEQRGMIKRLDV